MSNLHIVVGRLSNVRRHPEADNLYVEDVDIGSGQTRQVVSGLVNYLSLDEMEVLTLQLQYSSIFFV